MDGRRWHEAGISLRRGRQIHLHDFHATILHLRGLDHERPTHRYAGRDFRLQSWHKLLDAVIAVTHADAVPDANPTGAAVPFENY